QKLEREKGVRRAADAQVDLERIDIPLAGTLAAPRVKVDTEPAHDSARSEDAANGASSVLHLVPVGVRSRESASPVVLARWAAGDLVVRRNPHDLTLRVDAQLHAGCRRLRAFEELLDDATHPLELGEVARHGLIRRTELETRHRLLHRGAILSVGISE